MTIEIKVDSADRPNAAWTFGGQAIKSGGRFFLDVAREDNLFIIILEIDEVSLITRLSTAYAVAKIEENLLDLAYTTLYSFKISEINNPSRRFES